jgi:plastocyanin
VNCVVLIAVSILVFLVLSSPPLLGAQSVTGVISVVRREAGANTGKPDNADAVIWLKPESAGNPLRDESASAHPRFKMVQQHKRFEPRVLAVPAGSVVDFPNLDPFFHNVFSLFDARRFDLGLYEAGASHSVTFDRPGVCYLFCNIHPEMSAVVVVTDSPYYATSDKTGKFLISNVPPGRYLATVWHERGKPEPTSDFPRQVTISQENVSLPAIRLIDPGRLLAPHKNKYGRDYDTPKSPGPTYK